MRSIALLAGAGASTALAVTFFVFWFRRSRSLRIALNPLDPRNAEVWRDITREGGRGAYSRRRDWCFWAFAAALGLCAFLALVWFS